jgi:hypothetical protein
MYMDYTAVLTLATAREVLWACEHLAQSLVFGRSLSTIKRDMLQAAAVFFRFLAAGSLCASLALE